MPTVQPISDEYLDQLIEQVEKKFAVAAKRSFDVAAGAMRQSITADGGESFVSVDDAALAAQEWMLQVPALTAEIKSIYDGAVVSTIASIGEAVLPAEAQLGLTVPSILNQAAADHIAQSTSRISKLGDQAWSMVRSELLAGFQQGESIDKLSARVKSAAAMTEARAKTIARTEVIAASNAGTFNAARTLPKVMQPRLKEWLSTHDSRVRESHNAANGQQVLMNEAFEVGGFRMMFPGDPHGPPSETVNCRCTVLMNVDPVSCACSLSLTASADGGAAIKAARLALGLSRKQMAEKLGWSQFKLDKFELGKDTPTTADLDHIFKKVPEFTKHYTAAQSTFAPPTPGTAFSNAPPKPISAPGSDTIGNCACSKTKPTTLTQGTTPKLTATPKTAPLKPMVRTFATKTEGNAWGKVEFKQWAKDLPDNERAAIKTYTGAGYDRMNKALRGQLPTTMTGKNDLRRLNADAIRALHKAELSESIVVTRGGKFGSGVFKEGKIWRDEGFTSTSVSTKFEANVSKPDTYFTITLPEGTKGAYIGDVSAYKTKEAEFLLPPGSAFKVTKVEETIHGRRVYAELVNQDSLETALQKAKTKP